MACRLFMPNHHLNQCWLIVNWTLGNNFQWNLYQNSTIFYQGYTFENVFCNVSAIWFLYIEDSLRRFKATCVGGVKNMCGYPEICGLNPQKTHKFGLSGRWASDRMGAYYLLLWTWWRHQVKIFSALMAHCAGNSPMTGEFPAQRPVTQSFDVFFDLWPE